MKATFCGGGEQKQKPSERSMMSWPQGGGANPIHTDVTYEMKHGKVQYINTSYVCST